MLTPQITDFLLKAQSKALATTGPHGINVVPVSTIKIIDGKIILVDYFFQKSRENLLASDSVAMTAWSGLSGWQVKATCKYQNKGKVFNETVEWISQIHPDRKVKGIVELTPTEIHNISVPS